MRRARVFVLLAVVAAALLARAAAADPQPLVLVIHGGAGVIERAKMTPEKEASYRAGLAAALDAGYAVLERGGTSLDAVTAAVRTMEDDPQFNAGRGAVLNHEGDAELDAAIMDGNGPRAGAVAGVRHVKNPIELARLVMEKSPHVLLVGDGAEEFALEQGVVLVPRSYFRTAARVRSWRRRGAPSRRAPPGPRPHGQSGQLGTVGAVALDRAGNLAAATSTGGLTNKHRGRVGRLALIGAGTYANNESCAVSGTGQGEYYIRQWWRYDICALVEYQHQTLAQAVHEEIHEKLQRTGGRGRRDRARPRRQHRHGFQQLPACSAARATRAGRREIGMYRASTLSQ